MEEHVAEAGRLAAANYAQYRTSEPFLPQTWETREERETAIRGALGFGPGVAAIEHGSLQGFLVSRLNLGGPPPPSPRVPPDSPQRPPVRTGLSPPPSAGRRIAFLPPLLHACANERAFDVYREMYASLSTRLVANGFFTHDVVLPVVDKAGIDAWFSLGFGREMIIGVSRLDEIRAARRNVEVRRARVEDAAAVLGLLHELQRFHATAPIFWPYLVESQPRRPMIEATLQDESAPVWVAEGDSGLLGMISFAPSERGLAAARYERCIYIAEAVTSAEARLVGVASAILDCGREWAIGAGYELCSVGWASANVVSHRFWTDKGFKPTFYTLQRGIDEIITWANQNRDTRDLSLRP